MSTQIEQRNQHGKKSNLQKTMCGLFLDITTPLRLLALLCMYLVALSTYLHSPALFNAHLFIFIFHFFLTVDRSLNTWMKYLFINLVRIIQDERANFNFSLLDTNKWELLTATGELPEPRAGHMAVEYHSFLTSFTDFCLFFDVFKMEQQFVFLWWVWWRWRLHIFRGYSFVWVRYIHFVPS